MKISVYHDCNTVVYKCKYHYNEVIMGAIASPITSLTIVYSIVYSDADQRKHQSSASLAFVWGIHRGPVNSPQKWPVTRKMFPFDDVIMITVVFLEQNVLCYVDADPISTSLETHLWYRYMLYANNALLFCKVCDIAWKLSHGPSLLILQIWDHQVTAAQTKG